MTAQQFWDLITTETFAIPALWDYAIWDSVVYELMTMDRVRLDAYQAVIERHVRGKVVVEIGGGESLPLSMRCVRAGAARVYAIEADAAAAAAARRLVEAEGLSAIVTVIEGDSLTAVLPEPADICVSEIIGGIGSSEGCVAALDDAARFMRPDGRMIPTRCDTLVVPMQVPRGMVQPALAAAFEDHYRAAAERTFGRPISIDRYEFYNLPRDHWLAAPQRFERIESHAGTTTWEHGRMRFEVDRDGTFDGFMAWLNLFVDEDTMIETLHGTSWAPIRLAHAPIEVRVGDVIDVVGSAEVGADGAHPDYRIVGVVERGGGAFDEIDLVSRWLPD